MRRWPFRQTGSLWMFQIGLVDSLYLSGEIYDRVAALLYEMVLRDPTPIDWATSPLEALAVLSHPHPLSYEHWFEATLKRAKEPELALEIADRTRRHRYLSSLPLGGRLLALRWVLEGPPELLNEQSLAQRQDLLAKFARYQELDATAKKISADLAAKPVVEESRRSPARAGPALGRTGRRGRGSGSDSPRDRRPPRTGRAGLSAAAQDERLAAGPAGGPRPARIFRHQQRQPVRIHVLARQVRRVERRFAGASAVGI